MPVPDAVRSALWLSTWDCEQACRDGTEASGTMALLLWNLKQLQKTYFGWI